MPNYGEGLKGAGGGAMTGAALGSVVPGVGTGIGALVGGAAGGLLGMFGGGGGDENSRRMEEYRKMVMQRQAPQLGPVSNASTSDFRGNQQALIGRLEALANGTGPSMAAEQIKMATDRNMAQQQSIAQSGRGNATLANLVAANNSQNLGQGAAAQAAVAGTAEKQMALQQLGEAIRSGRGADEGLSQFNAQQNNFGNQANLEAKLRAMGLNDAAILNVMNQQTQQANRPTMGDQLLAGGVGALGMYAGQSGASRAATTQRQAPVAQGWNLDSWLRQGGVG